jgi:hypothetical protein
MLRDGVKAWVTINRFAADVDGRQLGPVPLQLRRRYMRAADLDGLPAGDELIVLSRATESVLETLYTAGGAWAALDGRTTCRTLTAAGTSLYHMTPSRLAARRKPRTSRVCSSLRCPQRPVRSMLPRWASRDHGSPSCCPQSVAHPRFGRRARRGT